MGQINIKGMKSKFQRYFISFIELTTRYAYTQPIQSRAEAPKIISKFLDTMQDQCQRKPRWLITDNAGEYTSTKIAEILKERNIQHLPTVPQNSEENGVAERFNLTIMNAVRAALTTTHMTWDYWTWALADATEKYNQLPHASTGK